jgi:hypothetical protein
VSTGDFLGVKPVREGLPPADQRVMLKLVDAMLDIRRRNLPGHPGTSDYQTVQEGGATSLVMIWRYFARREFHT